MSILAADPLIEIYDSTNCGLGESPLWHPINQDLFWVDLPNHLLFRKSGKTLQSWTFDEMVSAIGWIDEDHLLLATETGLIQFQISTEKQTLLCKIEADLPQNRSNDGRADPWGGFWVGTMSKSADKEAGSIYRWYQGELRKIARDITIPNGICFDKSRARAYFADSSTRKIFKLTLSKDTGWPISEAELFLNLSAQNLEIDGAIIDSNGHLWTAIWDAGCLQSYSPEAQLINEISVEIPRPTCPAFGGENYNDLYFTSAAIGLEEEVRDGALHGLTFKISNITQGQAEPNVIIVYKD